MHYYINACDACYVSSLASCYAAPGGGGPARRLTGSASSGGGPINYNWRMDGPAINNHNDNDAQAGKCMHALHVIV